MKKQLFMLCIASNASNMEGGISFGGAIYNIDTNKAFYIKGEIGLPFQLSIAPIFQFQLPNTSRINSVYFGISLYKVDKKIKFSPITYLEINAVNNIVIAFSLQLTQASIHILYKHEKFDIGFFIATRKTEKKETAIKKAKNSSLINNNNDNDIKIIPPPIANFDKATHLQNQVTKSVKRTQKNIKLETPKQLNLAKKNTLFPVIAKKIPAKKASHSKLAETYQDSMPETAKRIGISANRLHIQASYNGICPPSQIPVYPNLIKENPLNRTNNITPNRSQTTPRTPIYTSATHTYRAISRTSRSPSQTTAITSKRNTPRPSFTSGRTSSAHNSPPALTGTKRTISAPSFSHNGSSIETPRLNRPANSIFSDNQKLFNSRTSSTPSKPDLQRTSRMPSTQDLQRNFDQLTQFYQTKPQNNHSNEGMIALSNLQTSKNDENQSSSSENKSRTSSELVLMKDAVNKLTNENIEDKISGLSFLLQKKQIISQNITKKNIEAILASFKFSANYFEFRKQELKDIKKIIENPKTKISSHSQKLTKANDEQRIGGIVMEAINKTKKAKTTSESKSRLSEVLFSEINKATNEWINEKTKEKSNKQKQALKKVNLALLILETLAALAKQYSKILRT